MEKSEQNFNFSPYNNMDFGYDPMVGENAMFNPTVQYEQAYMYYRCLAQQMEYKIKCKEYEKMCGNNKMDKRVE